VARVTLRGIISDVVAMGATLLEVERETSWRWQERRLGGGKRDVLEVTRETSWTWKERHEEVSSLMWFLWEQHSKTSQ